MWHRATHASTLWASDDRGRHRSERPARPAKPPPSAEAIRAVTCRAAGAVRAGEVLEFDISWSDYLTAANATVTVKDKRPSFDSTAYYLVAEGQPVGLLAAIYSVYYKVDSLLDVYTLLPQRASVFSQEGRHRRMQVTRFDQRAAPGSLRDDHGNGLQSAICT